MTKVFGVWLFIAKFLSCLCVHIHVTLYVSKKSRSKFNRVLMLSIVHGIILVPKQIQMWLCFLLSSLNIPRFDKQY
jgi:hypothetical protein